MLSETRFVKTLKGHSGCKVELLQDDETQFVRKISKDASYNVRLETQMKLQKGFMRNIGSPKVYRSGHKGDLFFFDMEYIPGANFASSLEDIDYPTINNLLCIIFSELFSRSSDSCNPAIFEMKLIALKSQLSYNVLYYDVIQRIQPYLLRIESTTCGHGDLTLENILINDRGTLLYIDFLDSFFHSWKMDCAKLLQDFELMWSWRYDRISVNLAIKIEYCRSLLIDAIERYATPSVFPEIYSLLSLNVLRILPYCIDKITKNWCHSSLEVLLNKISKL